MATARADLLLAEVIGDDARNLMCNDDHLKQLHSETLTEIEIGKADSILENVSLRSIETILASTEGSLGQRASFSGNHKSKKNLRKSLRLFGKATY